MSPRAFLAAISFWLLAGCAALPAHDSPPVVFIHGEGESPALWLTALWRFESNGWVRERLVVPETPSAGEARAAAENGVVLRNPRAFGAEKFLETYRGITGRLPERADIVPETAPVLNGRSLPGAAIEVFEVSVQTAERLGSASYETVAGAEGKWGPFLARAGATYEFVIQAEGFAITHIYRSPFPRSSDLVYLYPARLGPDDKGSGGVVQILRPRVASASTRSYEKTVVTEFNGERIAARAWPGHVSIVEFHF